MIEAQITGNKGVELTERAKEILGILEEKHILSIIEYVDAHSPCMRTDVYREISRTATMSKKLDELKGLGLIDYRHLNAPSIDLIVITDKGRKVAGMVRSMSDILNNWELYA